MLMGLPSKTPWAGYSHSFHVYVSLHLCVCGEIEDSQVGQKTDSFFPEERAKPLSSISEISSVVRIRGQHITHCVLYSLHTTSIACLSCLFLGCCFLFHFFLLLLIFFCFGEFTLSDSRVFCHRESWSIQI